MPIPPLFHRYFRLSAEFLSRPRTDSEGVVGLEQPVPVVALSGLIPQFLNQALHVGHAHVKMTSFTTQTMTRQTKRTSLEIKFHIWAIT